LTAASIIAWLQRASGYAHICAGTGLNPATSAPGPGLHPATSAPGPGSPPPHLRRDQGSTCGLFGGMRGQAHAATSQAWRMLQHNGTDCNTTRWIATQRDGLQHNATDCNTTRRIATQRDGLQHNATDCNAADHVQRGAARKPEVPCCVCCSGMRRVR
jgi:hypothetical protein